MFTEIQRAKRVLEFFEERAAGYVRVGHDDCIAFRIELIKSVAGAGIAATAGLLFVCFTTVAVLVSAWESEHRILVAWCLCAAWGAIAAAGLAYAGRALSGPPPFGNVTAELLRDLSMVRNVE
jgi:hypothetical protein